MLARWVHSACAGDEIMACGVLSPLGLRWWSCLPPAINPHAGKVLSRRLLEAGHQSKADCGGGSQVWDLTVPYRTDNGGGGNQGSLQLLRFIGTRGLYPLRLSSHE